MPTAKKENKDLHTRTNAPPVRRTTTGVRQPNSDAFLWDQFPEETDAQFWTFQQYLAFLPADRSLTAVSRKIKRLRTVNDTVQDVKLQLTANALRAWAKKYVWKDRAAAYDKYKLACVHDEAVKALSSEYMASARVGEAMYTRAIDVLNSKDDQWWGDLTARDLKELIKLGTDLALTSRDRMIDLSVSVLDSATIAPTFEQGTLQESIFESITRGDWTSARELIAHAAAAEEMRLATMPTSETPITAQQQERVRALVSAIVSGTGGKASDETLAKYVTGRNEIDEDQIVPPYLYRRGTNTFSDTPIVDAAYSAPVQQRVVDVHVEEREAMYIVLEIYVEDCEGEVD